MFQRMHVTKLAFASLLTLGLGVVTGRAEATTISYSGSNCKPDIASISLVEYNPFSIFSTVTGLSSPAKVSCPIPIPFTTDSASTAFLNFVNVRVTDRNSNTLTGGDYSCTIFYENSAGTTITGASATPSHASAAAPFTFGLTANVTVAAATMICDIPNQTNNGVSNLLYYTVTTS
jgi:hypothetical protein